MALKKPTNRLVPKRPTQRYRYVRLRWHLFFAIFDAVGGALFGLVKLLKAFLPKKNGDDRGQSPIRSILIIQLDHLGDAILSTGMLRVLRQNYPEARIDILVGPWNRSLFEEMVPDVDRILVIDNGGRLARMEKIKWLGPIKRMGWPIAMLRQGLRLRRERYDLGIDVRGEMPHAAMMWVAGIGRRVGWIAGGGGFFLTDSPKWVPNSPEIESRRAILEAIGLNPDRQEMRPCLTVPQNDCSHEQENSKKNLLSSTDRYIALHLTAGTKAKEWPVEHWAELINELDSTPSNEPRPKIVLVGSPADHIIGQKVENLVVSAHCRPCNLIGKLSLRELGRVLQDAELMIGADSGPAHMAAALETRTITLFSGTNLPEQWQPPGEHVSVLKHDVPCRPCHQKHTCPVEGHPCMTGIAPKQVMKEILGHQNN